MGGSVFLSVRRRCGAGEGVASCRPLTREMVLLVSLVEDLLGVYGNLARAMLRPNPE